MSDLSPEEVVRRLQELAGSRYGFTAFHLYDQEIEGRVWANEFWLERHNRRRSVSRRLSIKVFAEGSGSKLAGHFGISTESVAAAGIFSILAVLWTAYQGWNAGMLRIEFVIPWLFLALPVIAVPFQLRRSLRAEPILLKFVEETLKAKAIVS
jgi:hypothetical protein